MKDSPLHFCCERSQPPCPESSNISGLSRTAAITPFSSSCSSAALPLAAFGSTLSSAEDDSGCEDKLCRAISLAEPQVHQCYLLTRYLWQNVDLCMQDGMQGNQHSSFHSLNVCASFLAFLSILTSSRREKLMHPLSLAACFWSCLENCTSIYFILF